MSRQSKAAKKKIVAAQFTKLHLDGQKGPSKTKPLHGKVRTQWKERQNKLKADAEAALQAAAEKQKKAKAEKQERAAAQNAPAAKAKAKPATKPAKTTA